jgi:hypothetical protein
MSIVNDHLELFYLSLLAKPINLSELDYHSTINPEVSECF